MIIKSKSYKQTRSFKTVLNYIFKEEEMVQNFSLTKFIKGKNPSSQHLEQQFLKNESYRQNPRKNNVVLYMDILSFHPKDAELLNDNKLRQIALKYLSLRAPNSIAVATVHRQQKEHTHLHVCFSGVEYKTGKSIRISKDDFKQKVKLEMERYQQEVFPELMRSRIRHEKPRSPKKELKKESEKMLETKGELSQKQQIIQLLEDTFKSAKSEQDFYQKLQDGGVKLYLRNQKIVGIEGTRKFRFARLGYTSEILQSLEQNPELSKRIKILETINQKRNEKDNELHQ